MQIYATRNCVGKGYRGYLCNLYFQLFRANFEALRLKTTQKSHNMPLKRLGRGDIEIIRIYSSSSRSNCQLQSTIAIGDPKNKLYYDLDLTNFLFLFLIQKVTFAYQQPVKCNGEKGRLRFEIMWGQLEFSRSKHFSWARIAKLLGI